MSVKEELETIRRNNAGVLRAEDVVAFASDPDTALHSRFTWDDTEAAQQYRLWQARQLIRVTVTILPGAEKSHRAYVSLCRDRYQEGGGYRTTVDVLTDAQRREELLAEALADLDRWRAKYKQLRELAPVFAAMDRVEKRQARRAAVA